MIEVIVPKNIRDELDKKGRNFTVRVTKEIELLQKFGHKLKYPHVKKIGKDICELRARGNPQIRLFYTYKDGRVVVFDFYIKKTQKIPKQVLRRIYKRAKKLEL